MHDPKTADLEAERGALALANLRIDRYAELALDAGHYSLDAYAGLHEAAMQLYRDGEGRRLFEWARSQGRYANHVQALYDAPAMAPQEALRRLRTKKTARRTWEAVRGLSAAISADDGAAMAAAAQAVAEAALPSDPSELTTMAQVVMEVADRMASPEARDGWVFPGSEAWAEAVGWFKPGQLTILAAGTNVGKSQAAMHVLEGLSARATTCGYVSVEDERDVPGQRAIARLTGVSPQAQDDINGLGLELRQKLFDGLDQRLVDQRLGRLIFAERVGESAQAIESTIMRMASKGCRLIAVDYLQEIDTTEMMAKSRHEAISQLVRRLKALAVRHRFHLMLISQLNREGAGEARKGNEPSMHSLKESGDIENKAELIVMMWRNEHGQHCLKLVKAKGRPNIGHTWFMARNADMGGMLDDYDVRQDAGGQTSWE